MGLLLIFALGLYGGVAGLVILLIARYLTKNKWVISALIVTAVLIPTYDIILTNALGTYYCAQEPNPKTLISKKVEYPQSIYWEDNVYPGFSKEDRALMITNYLDGVHLKTIALNGADGENYVYTREVPQKEYLELNNEVLKISEEIKKMQTFQKDRQDEQYIKNINQLYKERERIQNKVKNLIDAHSVEEEKFSKETMPKMNYTVTFDEVKLNAFSRKFLYSDETKVIENQTGETIAYNRRVMRFFYNAFPDVALGNIYYYPHPICGYEYPFNTMFNYQRTLYQGGISHVNGLNQKLYNKYIKGEK